MVERVLKLLDENKNLSMVELDKKLGIRNLEETNKLIEKMIKDLLIIKTNKNKITKVENSRYLKGVIQTKAANKGFVIIKDHNDVLVKDLKGAIDGDEVLITLIKNDLGKIERIRKNKDQFVGTIENKNGKTYVILDNKKVKYKVLIRKHFIDGMKVEVKLYDMVDKKTYSGNVVSVLGHKDDPGIDLLSITTEFGVQKEFPEKVINEVKNIPNEITNNDIKNILSKGGKDLREEKIFTIDGDDTKDIDDALSVKILNNGNYQVGVHIANVSHYVKPSSELFKNATERGTSVYIPGSSIPMLPRELSNGICSLNPNVDRLALSFIMEIDKSGQVVDFKIHESIINSKIKMTYKKVNKILENNEISDGYENFINELKMLNRIAILLRKRRKMIDFDMNENKILVDELGVPIDIILRERGTGEKLIEDFMVETGYQSSKFLDKLGNGKKHVYRNHDVPNEEKLQKFISFLSSLGYKKMTKCINELKPSEVQILLDNLKNTKEFEILKRELLKSMAKAVYSSNNAGHFALSLDTYCQTTSPIRRSGDLINHVLIKENIYTNQTAKLETELPTLASTASLKERNAILCERESNKLKTAEYMEKHIGEEFIGTITGFTKYGIFIELPNMIEGLVKTNTLDDNYVFDEKTFTYVGRTTKKILHLGDQVNILVVGANKEDKTIDFEIISAKKYVKKHNN